MGRKAEVRLVAERRYWREAEARVLVEAWQSSGETPSEFARRHGVEPRRLARWVSRLQGAGEEPLHFHAVRLVESPAEAGDGAPIEIQLSGGRRVRVPRGFEAEDLRRVLAVLEAAAPC
jgi:transposase-like protein